MKDRIGFFRTTIGHEDVSVIVNKSLRPNPNFIYLSGVNVSGMLVIPRHKPAFLLTNARDLEQAKASSLKIEHFDKKKNSFENLKKILMKKKLQHKNIGIDKLYMSVISYEKMRKMLPGNYHDVGKKLRKQRSIKDADEISYLKRACKITDEVFSKIVSDFSFETEGEIRRFLDKEIQLAGAELSFPPIIAMGKHASMPHYEGDAKLKKGFLLFDYGAKYKGYHADMSRTIYLGSPTKKEKKRYELVLNVQKDALLRISPGYSCGKLYDDVVKDFGDYAEKFIHGLGHGVGLEIHELPNISLDSEDVFHENMVFTIEPGLYFEGKYGIRIEDTVVLKKNKITRLTNSSKELIQIKR